MVEFYFKIQHIFRNTYSGLIISNFFELIVLIGPYFVVSVVLNVLLRYYFFKNKMMISTKNETMSIIIAGGIGILSPLPTYIAVPMGLSLITSGIPLSAAVAFIIASPLMNPGLFYLTYTQLGLEMAAARLISAFVLSLVAGFLSKFIWRQLCSYIKHHPTNTDKNIRPIWIEFMRSFLFLGKYFVIALVISALVKSLVPEEFISKILGGNARMSLIAAIAMGIPFYSCGGAAIPLIQVLSEMGMNKGAVLSFFIAGPSTKLETIYVYKSLLGYKFLLYFLSFTLISSFLCGLILLKL